jgi:NADH-quinone oxidoreductase subunit L
MMPWIVKNLWLIPALPLLAAGVSALLPQRFRKLSASLAIVSMIGAFLLSLCAFAHAVQHNGHDGTKEFFNFAWLQFAAGDAGVLKLGWVLDPLTAVMLVMVTFVGTLIFIYSTGYMAPDENFTRFFTFLSLFAAAMLGIVIANSLLLLFICWELVGLASYLLIGFWYHKPSAAAAAKKAFITTRIGDVFFFLGMVWLYHETGTLLFYDDGKGCLELMALNHLALHVTTTGMLLTTAIGLLIFAGAVGKSGQVPLHVWLPDAMEGPTPVSALIHAATMVAAGVFLVARLYSLMANSPEIAGSRTPVFSNAMVVHDSMNSAPKATTQNPSHASGFANPTTGSERSAGIPAAYKGAPKESNKPLRKIPTVIQVITWIGAITAFFAASIAVAQNDIKRILAYSTVSQLGYMMMGLGTGGVAVGMFHLITHAFFKALLFMGAGSVIHGCHHEQDIRKMGGIRNYMPVTFLTYAIGMMALAGVPLFFSGFWSKDAILHAAHGWSVSHIPFYLGVAGALLTAFYMTRQMALVFWGKYRGHVLPDTQHIKTPVLVAIKSEHEPHESPRSMTVPLIILAVCAIGLGAIGTPAWPWFQEFLGSHHEEGFSREVVQIMMVSGLVVLLGGGLGAGLYGYVQRKRADEPDVLEKLPLGIHTWLAKKYGIDELYELTVIRFNAWAAKACAFLDEWIWGGVVTLVSYVMLGLSWASRAFDEFVINLGFDQGCERVSKGGSLLSRLQDGHVQNYLRVIGVALVVLVLFLIWGGGK